MQITEHRRNAVGLADLLLYDSLVEDGVLLLQDGALLAGWSFEVRIWPRRLLRDGSVERAAEFRPTSRQRVDDGLRRDPVAISEYPEVVPSLTRSPGYRYRTGAAVSI